jgi:hypothetical protein
VIDEREEQDIRFGLLQHVDDAAVEVGYGDVSEQQRRVLNLASAR